MGQGVIATFMEMVKVLKRSEKIIKDYWCTFNILKGINNTDTAWEEVSVNYLKVVQTSPKNYARLYTIWASGEHWWRHLLASARGGIDEVTAEDK